MLFMTKERKLKAVLALLSKGEGKDRIFIQPKPADTPVFYCEIPNGRDITVDIHVTSIESAKILIEFMKAE